MVTKIMLLLAAFYSSVSLAGTQTGRINTLYAHDGDVVIFGLTGTYTNPPPCSYGQWVIDLTKPTGKAQYALLLYAEALGKEVQAFTNANACFTWTQRERPEWIHITP